MKRFGVREILEARAHAALGGQALHCMPSSFVPPTAPRCFRGRDFAHLLDQDRERLIATAKRLGVRVIEIDRAGTPDQHIDLVGTPYARALLEVENKPHGRPWERDTAGAFHDRIASAIARSGVLSADEPHTTADREDD